LNFYLKKRFNSKIIRNGRAFELKGRKMKRWSAMAKAFTRIGKDIDGG
jgi:hypothetical protein